MKIAITGGTGLLGQFLTRAALDAGHQVTLLGRRPPAPGVFPGGWAFQPWALGGPAPALTGHGALIHAALDHLPGRYRGGEGADAAGFIARNQAGSQALFAQAQAQGLGRVVFLSSRAVLAGHGPAKPLTEDLPPRPDSLYGAVKAACEADLLARAGADFRPLVLRATGVYGPPAPGQTHKWVGLFNDFWNGAPIAPRRATEVHGADLAEGLLRLLGAPSAGLAGQRVFHASDLVLDRAALLAALAAWRPCAHPPPPADDRPVAALDCAGLRGLGWRPGGWARLRASLPALSAAAAVPLGCTPPKAP